MKKIIIILVFIVIIINLNSCSYSQYYYINKLNNEKELLLIKNGKFIDSLTIFADSRTISPPILKNINFISLHITWDHLNYRTELDSLIYKMIYNLK